MYGVLEKRWQRFVERIGADEGSAKLAWKDLFSRYSEPHRHYHTWVHIEHMLDAFEQVRHLLTEPDAVEMAIWYHDAVYDPHSGENEHNSAELAARMGFMMKMAVLNGFFIATVAGFILATRHTRCPKNINCCYLLDIDLLGFAQPSEVFDLIGRHIREEYKDIPEEVFNRERVKILQGYLNRERIYLTDYFHDKYEDLARENLKRAIARLINDPQP